MKFFPLYCFFLLLPFYAISTNYYVSEKGNDNNNGKTPAQAWQSIDKVNASMNQLSAGDSVLFKRGESFYGQINLTADGANGNPLVFGAYGSGNLPVISGERVLTNWVQHSGNIWRTQAQDSVAYLYWGDKFMTLARFPNAGFLTMSNGDLTWLTSNEMSRPTNYWQGANVRMRTTKWTWEFQQVSASTDTRLDFVGKNKYTAKQDWGFFLDNKLTELDMPGEWYYNDKTGIIYFWAPANSNPNNKVAIASSARYGIYSPFERHDVVIENLDFKRQIVDAISFEDRDNERIYVQHCEFYDQGKTSVTLYGKDVKCNYSYFEGALGRGVKGHNIDVGEFNHNVMKNIGLHQGFGISGNQGMNGFHFTRSDYVDVSYNRIDTVGYTGISCYLAYSTVENNIVNGACLKLDDGGGIYCFGTQTHHTSISNNFVTYVPGNSDGVNKVKAAAHGIYLDKDVTYMNVHNNTVKQAKLSGIFINTHNKYNDIRENVLYGNEREQMVIAETGGINKTFENDFVDNVCYSLDADVNSVRLISLFGTEGNLADYTNNYFINPYSPFIAEVGNYTNKRRHLMEEWDERWPNVLYSNNESFFQFDGYNVDNVVGNSLVDNGTFDNDASGWLLSTGGNVGGAWLNNTKLDGGSYKLTMTSGSPSTARVRSMLNGPIQGGRFYQLKVSVSGDAYEVMKVIVQQGNVVLGEMTLPTTKGRRDYVRIFQAGNNGNNAEIRFESKWGTGKGFIIDNIELTEVAVSPVTPTDKAQLLENPTDTPKKFTLNGNFKTVDGTPLGTDITVQPFMSVIVISEDATVINQGADPVAIISANPDNGPAPLTVNFNGSPSFGNPGKIVGYEWDFGDGNVASGPIQSHIYTNVGQYVATLLVIDEDGRINQSNHVITVTQPGSTGSCGGPYDGWITSDVGNIQISGSACQNGPGGGFQIDASGKQINGKIDQFHYVYRPVSGDVNVVAKINSVEQAAAWSMSGLMMRENLSDNCRNAMVGMGAQERFMFQRRINIDDITVRNAAASGSISFPHWVKLERVGNTFSGYHSNNGKDWILINSESIEMPTNILLGMAASSFTNQTTISTSIDEVKVEGGASFPVELIDFGADFVGEELLLKWSTATESNNDFFTIEKSLDGVLFQQLENIPGVGTSNTIQQYNTFDREPAKGVSYYRLKQTDFDGSFQYLSTIRVTNDRFTKADLAVFPNPTTKNSRININLQGLEAEDIQRLYLIDPTGREVELIRPVAKTFQVNLPDMLPSGTYILVASHRDGLIQSPLVVF
ncbi:MAG: PKD domain-containing protein [Bacteroidota bacterium]